MRSSSGQEVPPERCSMLFQKNLLRERSVSTIEPGNDPLPSLQSFRNSSRRSFLVMPQTTLNCDLPAPTLHLLSMRRRSECHRTSKILLCPRKSDFQIIKYFWILYTTLLKRCCSAGRGGTVRTQSTGSKCSFNKGPRRFNCGQEKRSQSMLAGGLSRKP